MTQRRSRRSPCMLCRWALLLQLLALRPAWEGFSRLWVTDDTSDARSLLASEDVVYAHWPTSRNLRTLTRNLRLARRVVWKARPAVVVTTGAATAVPFAWTGRLCGAKVVYIESVTRIHEPSLSCRLVAPVAGARRRPVARAPSRSSLWAVRRQRAENDLRDHRDEPAFRPAPGGARRAGGRRRDGDPMRGLRSSTRRSDVRRLSGLCRARRADPPSHRCRARRTPCGAGSCSDRARELARRRSSFPGSPGWVRLWMIIRCRLRGAWTRRASSSRSRISAIFPARFDRSPGTAGRPRLSMRHSRASCASSSRTP